MENSHNLSEALQLLSEPNFRDHATSVENLIKIKLKINEELLDQPNETSLRDIFKAENSILITFESIDVSSVNKIFWRVIGSEKFHLLVVFEDYNGIMTENCENFLEASLENGKTGILIDSLGKKYLELSDLGDENGLNLFILAVINNRDDLVDKLLEYGFDVNDKFKIDNVDKNAIDIAWEMFTKPQDDNSKKITNNIILSLLNANSTFPCKFVYNDASTEVQNFTNDCKEFHKLMKSWNLKSLEEKLEAMPDNLINFYDDNNQSLLMCALKMDIDSETYELLNEHNLRIGPHETEESTRIFKRMRDKNQANANEPPELHIILKAKSRTADYDKNINEHFKHIEEVYKILDQNESCSKVLKVIVLCKNLKIFFDFKHDSTHYFDPTSSVDTRANAYSTGKIQIGAKELLDEHTKFTVIGAVIHEFCHLAVFMTFMNDFNPYPMGESEAKERFLEKVAMECEENRESEGMVENVFNPEAYREEHQHSELIVLVAQMLMHYHVEDPHAVSINLSLIEDRKKNFPELFKYVEEVVEPEFVKVLPVLKKLQDDGQEVRFSELTEPMKEKILHKIVKFQGIQTSLIEILGGDENFDEIFELLSSKNIKSILLSGKDFEIGQDCKLSTKYGYVHRNFIQNEQEQNKKSPKTLRNFEEVKKDVEKSKIFILSGKAGDGKTTVFEKLTKKLKKNHKNFWVAFIKLRSFRQIFDGLNLVENFDLNEIFEMFCKILFQQNEENSKFEVRIFKKLFFDDKVILLLDGIDEICPKFNEFMIKILSILKSETKNQLWVSTRPLHVEQLKSALNVGHYELEPYGYDERNTLINKIVKNDENSSLKLNNFFKNFTDFNNPLLIIMVTEIFLSGKIDLQTQSVDRFGIYKLLVDEQMRKFDEKIDYEDRKNTLKISFVLQVLAIKFMFNELQIKDLKIMKKWERKKRKWTAEKIQRFGFVTIDLKFLETNDRNSIDFIHFTFAEFFVTQYIIDKIFKRDKKEKVIEKIFKLLKDLQPKWRKNSFLISFLRSNWKYKEKKLHKKLKELIIDEIEGTIRNEEGKSYISHECLRFWCPFLKNKEEKLLKLWQENQEKTLFKKLLFNKDICTSTDFPDFLEFINDCLGENWHEILNKSDQKLKIEVEGLKSLDCDEKSVKYFENFYKFLILIENNFSDKEKDLFKRKLPSILEYSNVKLHGSYFDKCFTKILSLCENDLEIMKIIFSQMIKHVDVTNLNYTHEFLDVKFKENPEEILLIEDVMRDVMNRIAFVGDKKEHFEEKFNFFMQLYLNFINPWNELQIVFLCGGNFHEILKIMPENFHPKFVDYMKKIFGSNRPTFFEYLVKGTKFLDGKILSNLEGFLDEFFDDDQNLVRESMTRVTTPKNIKQFTFTSESAKDFQKVLNIFQKYSNDLVNFFKSWEILSEIFFKMSEDSYQIFKNLVDEIFKLDKNELIECVQFTYWNLYIIKSEEKFNLLEKLLSEFFIGYEINVRKCIRKMIVSDPDFYNILKYSLCDKKEFERVENLLTKYLTKEELKREFLAQNVLLNSFDFYSLECHQKFVKFVKNVNQANLDWKFDSNLTLKLVKNEEGFKYFEKFSSDFHENDENQARNFVRKLLFCDYISHFMEQNLFLESLECLTDFEHLRRIYTKYKNSWEELQIFFKTKPFDASIFRFMTEKSLSSLEEFLSEIFESNKMSLKEINLKNNLENYNQNEIDYYFDEQHKERLREKFEKFLKSDENKSDKKSKGKLCSCNCWSFGSRTEIENEMMTMEGPSLTPKL